MEIEGIKDKALRRFVETGKPKGLPGDLVDRLFKMINFIIAAETVDELGTPPNYGLHPLTGDRAGTWAMTPSQLADDILDRRRRFDHRPGFGGLSLMAIKVHPSFAIHAGEWLKTEVVEANGVSINELTEAFRVSRQTVSAVLNGRTTLTADMAIRFEHAFGVKAETLLRMHARYELAKAREHEADLAVKSLIAA